MYISCPLLCQSEYNVFHNLFKGFTHARDSMVDYFLCMGTKCTSLCFMDHCISLCIHNYTYLYIHICIHKYVCILICAEDTLLLAMYAYFGFWLVS